MGLEKPAREIIVEPIQEPMTLPERAPEREPQRTNPPTREPAKVPEKAMTDEQALALPKGHPARFVHFYGTPV